MFSYLFVDQHVCTIGRRGEDDAFKKSAKNRRLFNARFDAVNIVACWIKHVDIEQADRIRPACSI